MLIEVEHIDRHHVVRSATVPLSLAAFLKHVAICGQGEGFGVAPSIARGLGALMFYSRFIKLDASGSLLGFRKPNDYFADPTEQSQFSNLVGKAISDFLAKRLAGARYTHTYEAAMRLYGIPIIGSRPDLYCTTETEQFSLEAKGYTAKYVTQAQMDEHKLQARSGPLPVNFSVASVAYNLYEDVKCKFHDPVSEGAEFATELNNQLKARYYGDLTQELSSHFSRTRFEYQGVGYDQYDVSPYIFFSEHPPRISLIVDSRYRQWMDMPRFRGLDQLASFGENLYVDYDGIGVKIG